MSDAPNHAAKPGHVPDLHSKLAFLLKERGGRDGPYMVTNQSGLAAALGFNGSQVTRWMKDSRIPELALVAPRIAAIFRCDEMSFRTDPHGVFVAKTLGLQVTWDSLVAGAEPVGKVEPPGARILRAGPADEDFEGEHLPILQPKSEFKVRFEVGQGRFTGWHVLAFCGDSDGYLCWIPRSRSTAFKGMEKVFSGADAIELPALRGTPLKVGEHAQGRHDVVVVLSKEPYQREMLGDLAAEPERRDKLTPAPVLDRLAKWIAIRQEMHQARMLRASFCAGFAPGQKPETVTAG